MSEETITSVIISMKIDSLEAVLSAKQRKEYQKLLQLKKSSFIKIWGKYLTEERLQDALLDFDI